MLWTVCLHSGFLEAFLYYHAYHLKHQIAAPYGQDKWVLQILITHKTVLSGSFERRKKKKERKKNLVCMWEIQRFEKFIVTLSAAANIKVKETCNNLGSACVCVCRCVCAQLVGIEVIMLLINVAPWLLSQQCSVFGFLLLRWNLVTSLRLLESCRINVRSCLIHSPHNMLWSMRYDSY